MNVLIVSQYFHPETFIINSVARDLARLGHAVTVLTGMPNYPGGRILPGYRVPRIRRERLADVDIVRVPIIPRGGTAFQLALNYLSYAISASLLGPAVIPRRVDVVLAYQPSPITVGLPALVAKWFKRAPILFWVQDLWPESLVATGAVRNRHVLNLVRSLVRFIYARCDVILTQSRSLVCEVRKDAPPGADIRYLPNFADQSYVPTSLPADAPERALLRPGFQVVCAGNMGAAQDLGTVLDAAERLRGRPDIKWVIIGKGRMRLWVEEQVRVRGLDATVQILGPYPPEQMPAFFAIADVLLATLRKDRVFALTVPSRVQSYLASGRPIVAAIDGEGGRIIEEARAGLSCPASDPVRLAQAVEMLCAASAAEREAMGRSGRDYFDREFARDLLMKRLDEWLRAVGKCG